MEIKREEKKVEKNRVFEYIYSFKYGFETIYFIIKNVELFFDVLYLIIQKRINYEIHQNNKKNTRKIEIRINPFE